MSSKQPSDDEVMIDQISTMPMSTKSLLKQKFIAFSSHLLISLVVASLSLYLVYYVWYPHPLDIATNVTSLFLLMITIDIIIGPLLTFVVYKKPKKTLKLDLTVIALLQAGALLYGLNTVYEGRPAWIAFDVDRFELVRVNDIDSRAADTTDAKYKTPPVFGAQYVNVTFTEEEKKQDIDLNNTILLEQVMSGIGPAQRPELYKPIATADEMIVQKTLSLAELYTFNDKAVVDKVLAEYKTADGFLVLKANDLDMTVLIDTKAQNKVLGIVNLRPWELIVKPKEDTVQEDNSSKVDE